MRRQGVCWPLPTMGLLCGAIVLSASLSGRAQQPTFRSDVRTVAIYATVQDGTGRLVPDLPRDAFQVFEDGVLREISQFSSDPPPLNVAIMLDTSLSVAGDPGIVSANRLRHQGRHAVLAFMDALRPVDRASVGTFGAEIAVGANLTNDRNEIRRVLDEEVWGGGGTPLWQALLAAMRVLEAEPGRRVVLVFTDGADTGTLPGLPGGRSNVQRYALRTESMVYVIGLTVRPELRDEIRDVAEASGGGYFILPADADLRDTFVRVAEELRHQYLIGFVPVAANGLEHRVEIRTTQPGLRVRARQTFIAGAQ